MISSIPQKRILCIFKKQETFKKFTSLLEKESYFVYYYSKIIEAQGQMLNDPPDIILLDALVEGWMKFLNTTKTINRIHQKIRKIVMCK